MEAAWPSTSRKRPLADTEILDELRMTDEDDVSDCDSIGSTVGVFVMDEESEEEEDGDGDGAARKRRRTAPKSSCTAPSHSAWSNGTDDCTPISFRTYNFDNRNCGITDEAWLGDDSDELAYFLLFFNNELVTEIVEQTNKYFTHIYNITETPNPMLHSWHDATVNEMYTFIGLLLLMPHVKKNSINDYWREQPLIHTPIFPKCMERDRFKMLLRFLYFGDENDCPASVADDKLPVWKTKPILAKFTEKTRQLFRPFQNLVIDESPVLFPHRRLTFMNTETSEKINLKVFVLSDCLTGIILDMMVCVTDADVPMDDPLDYTCRVAKELVDKYLDKGHILYANSWCMSLSLSAYLHEHKTGARRMLRKNKKVTPESVGRREAGKRYPVSTVEQTEEREATRVSTIHREIGEDSGKVDSHTPEPMKESDEEIDYKNNVRLIKRSGVQITSLEFASHNIKWHKIVFFHLLDTAMLNAFILYKVNTGKTPSLRLFSRTVIGQMLDKFGKCTESLAGPDRLAARDYIMRHNLQQLPPSGSRLVGQRSCQVCLHTNRRQRRNKKVSTWCAECGVGLCYTCFRDFHTLKEF